MMPVAEIPMANRLDDQFLLKVIDWVKLSMTHVAVMVIAGISGR